MISNLLKVLAIFTLASNALSYTTISHSKIRYIKIKYRIKKKDSFIKIIKKYTRNKILISSKSPLVISTAKRNKHIKNWKRLPRGKTIVLYIPSYQIKKSILKKLRKKKSKWNHSLFYMASSGTFNQKSSDNIAISFNQNSPISLGYATSYYSNESRWSQSGSIYFSYLAAGTSSQESSVSIPPEIGGSYYLNYQKSNLLWPYLGFDFEKFNSFDINILQTTNKLDLETNNVLYATFGNSFLFNIFGLKLYSKLSVSKTIFSKTSTTVTNTINGDLNYSGFRYLVYLNTKISKKFFVHFLYKQHIFEGPTKLNIARSGIGFGYNF